MKAVRTITLIFLLSLLVLSCEKDEPFYQVSVFETAIHNNVSDYRVSQGLDPLVWFPPNFIDAREQALAWKKSGDPYDGINEREGRMQDELIPTTFGRIMYSVVTKNADTTLARAVVNNWIANDSIKALMLDDVVQSGAGSAQSEDIVYIVHYLMNVPSK